MKLIDFDKAIRINTELDGYSEIINKYIEKIDIKPKFIREKDGRAYIRREIYKDNNQITYDDIPLHKWANDEGSYV